MQNDKKLYITNIPLNVTQSELKNALQIVQQGIKVRLYQKLGESLGQGEITFQTSEDCVNFIQQQKIKHIVIYDQELKFKPFVQRQNQQNDINGTNATNINAENLYVKQPYSTEKQYKYKLVCYLNVENQEKSEKDLLHLFRKYCPRVSSVQKRPVIIDGQDSKIVNAILIFSNENLSTDSEKDKKRLQTSSDAIQALSKGKIVARLLVGVEKDRSLERLRVILRNVPNCADDELVKWLINEMKVPIRHIKRSGGFCFATTFAEEDAVSIVKAKELNFGKRKVIPDFVLDEMRLQYGNSTVIDKNEPEESSYKYSYYSESDTENGNQNNVPIELEHYDPKLGVEHYINQKIEPEKEQNDEYYSSGSYESSQQTDYETEFGQQNNDESKDNSEGDKQAQEKMKKNDENTLFIQGVPKQLEASLLDGQRRLFEKDGISFANKSELIEVAVRKSICDLFRRFGRIKKISLPTDVSGSLRGIAFVQFEEETPFEAVLQYIRTLHQIAHDVFGYKPIQLQGKDNDSTERQKENPDALVRLKVNMGFLDKVQSAPDADLLKKVPPEKLKSIYEDLAKIANVPRIHINLLNGSLQVFRTPLTVKSFLNKKALNSLISQRGTEDRCIELLKFDLLIQGALSAAELEKRGIDESQQQQRMKVYKHMKSRLEDVNNRLNPLRVQLRNFPIRITEETILEHMWERLTQAAKIAWEMQNVETAKSSKKAKNNGFPELPEPVNPKYPPQHLVQVLKDQRIIELGKKLSEKQDEAQEEPVNSNSHMITAERLNDFRNCLYLKALRAGRTSGLQHELLRGFNQAKQQALKDSKSEKGLPSLTGIVYADFDSETHAKQFIQLFNGAKMFTGTQKAIIACFAMENNLRDVKRESKSNSHGRNFSQSDKKPFRRKYGGDRQQQNSTTDRNNSQQMHENAQQSPKKLTRDKKRRLAKKLMRVQH